jgi:O-antigen/teichoic acid export membrane protein
LGPITFVLFPRSVAAWNLNKKAEVNEIFSQAISLTLILSLPAIVGLFVVSRGLVTLLAGKNYSTSNDLVLFLLLAGLATVIYQNHIFIIHLIEKTFFLPLLFISTATINYVLCYLFVLKFGITGAAVARFVTYGIMALIVTIWGRKYIKFTIPWWTIFKVALASIIMGVSISWMPVDTVLQLAGVVVSGALVYILMLFIFRVLTFERLNSLKGRFA